MTELTIHNNEVINSRSLKGTKKVMRNNVIDTARGILIILVVIGHSADVKPMVSNIIYWFHMPAFFILSGFVFKDRGENPLMLFLKLIRKYYIPFWIYFFLNLLYVKLGTLRFNLTKDDLITNLWGGRDATGSVYWFPTVLIITVFTYTLLKRYLKPKVYIPVILFMYLAAHYESLVLKPETFKEPVFWGADIALISIFYFFLGDFLGNELKEYTNKSNFIINAAVLLIALVLMDIQVKHFGSKPMYSLNLKYGVYSHLLLDIVIPLVFTLSVLTLSKLLNLLLPFKSVFSLIGKNTIGIMYLHVSMLAMYSAKKVPVVTNIFITVLICAATEIFINWIKSYFISGDVLKYGKIACVSTRI